MWCHIRPITSLIHQETEWVCWTAHSLLNMQSTLICSSNSPTSLPSALEFLSIASYLSFPSFLTPIYPTRRDRRTQLMWSAFRLLRASHTHSLFCQYSGSRKGRRIHSVIYLRRAGGTNWILGCVGSPRQWLIPEPVWLAKWRPGLIELLSSVWRTELSTSFNIQEHAQGMLQVVRLSAAALVMHPQIAREECKLKYVDISSDIWIRHLEFDLFVTCPLIEFLFV